MDLSALIQQLKQSGIVRLGGVESIREATALTAHLSGTTEGNLSTSVLEVARESGGKPSQTESDIPLHQENYHMASRPRYLSLWCISSAQEGEHTQLVRNDDILDRLPSEFTAMLQSCSIRFHRLRGVEPTSFFPLLEEKEGYRSLRYAMQDSRFRSVEICCPTGSIDAKIILNALEESILTTKRYEIAFDKSEFLIFDNFRFLHGRTALKPGSSRILHRATVYPLGHETALQ